VAEKEMPCRLLGGLPALELLDGRSHRIHALKHFLGCRRIGDFQTKTFIEGNHQLKCVHRVQTQAALAKERLVIAYFTFGQLEHEVFNHHSLDLIF
jgi:hypothetical protein